MLDPVKLIAGLPLIAVETSLGRFCPADSTLKFPVLSDHMLINPDSSVIILEISIASQCPIKFVLYKASPEAISLEPKIIAGYLVKIKFHTTWDLLVL